MSTDCGDGRRPDHGRERRDARSAPGRGRVFLIATCAALAAAGTIPAFGQERAPDLEMGGRLVKARCVACHGEAGMPNLVARCVGEHGEAYLDDFLARHHAPDDEARADIIAYLTCPPDLLPAD